MSSNTQIDPRGPRFGAWITTVVLAVVILTNWWPLLAAQTIVFAIGGFLGLQYAPYGLIYRRFVAPRLRPTTEREDTAPPQFAQSVGFAFAFVGVIGYLVGLPILGIIATAAALIAAFLNAAFAFCLGCEMYLIIKRFFPAQERS